MKPTGLWSTHCVFLTSVTWGYMWHLQASERKHSHRFVHEEMKSWTGIAVSLIPPKKTGEKLFLVTHASCFLVTCTMTSIHRGSSSHIHSHPHSGCFPPLLEESSSTQTLACSRCVLQQLCFISNQDFLLLGNAASSYMTRREIYPCSLFAIKSQSSQLVASSKLSTFCIHASCRSIPRCASVLRVGG